MIKTPLTTGDAAQMYCPLIQLQKFHFLEIITIFEPLLKSLAPSIPRKPLCTLPQLFCESPPV
jgi:hypothetical protein